MQSILETIGLLTIILGLISTTLWLFLSIFLAFTLFKYRHAIVFEVKRAWNKIFEKQ